ncbi:MAG: flagellar basal body-associated FliL family protein [Bdellovibrionales bacterium]|nr:flagellar basal body-associated FliL family protein [Bdellovibrionales bacterium]
MSNKEVSSKNISPSLDPSNVQPQTPWDEVDQILSESDPDFTRQLSEIKSVATESEVLIESVLSEGEILEGENDENWLSTNSHRKKIYFLISKIKLFFRIQCLKIKQQTLSSLTQFFIYARTLPREFSSYLKVMGKNGKNWIRNSWLNFKNLNLKHKLSVVLGLILSILLLFMISANLKGIWLPPLFAPEITKMDLLADQVWEISGEDSMVSLFSAFPQEELEFLMPKFFVNLQPSSEHPHPMGAFEFYLTLDSKNSAFEVESRQKELHDLMQREIEALSYPEVNGVRGKERLKSALRGVLNDSLSQGWVKEVFIKTIVLKP